jgi:iron complex transport system substrate-binding protein
VDIRTLIAGVPVALATLALLPVAGCGGREEPLGKLQQQYPVTVRGAGDQPATLKRVPERIVALDPGSAELLRALGVGRRLVGVPASIEPRAAEEVVRRTGQIDVGAVARLEPDLIVVTPATDRVDTSRASSESGATLYVQPASSIEDVEKATLELGFLVARPVKARTLVGKIKRAVAEVDRRISAARPLTVFIDTGFFITVPERSLLGELVRRAHGENVAADNAGLGPFDEDLLAELDPDVYIATSDSRTTLEKLRTRPKTRNLTSVREGRFVVLDADLAMRAGPRIAEAYEAVALALHPDAFR